MTENNLQKKKFAESQEFLRKARSKAKKEGYNSNNLFLSEKKDKKLVYKQDGRPIHFGAKGYGDFIYYSTFKPELAKQKRNVFQKSHGAIKDKGKYSPNQLALKILW